MATRTVKMQACDNPGCEFEAEVVKEEALPWGYRLKAGTWDSATGGGYIPAVYVCKLDCLVPAIEHAIGSVL